MINIYIDAANPLNTQMLLIFNTEFSCDWVVFDSPIGSFFYHKEHGYKLIARNAEQMQAYLSLIAKAEGE